MSQDDQRARKRDERERETIMAMVMIAPTPEMVRQVMALAAEDDDTAHRPAGPATRAERDKLPLEAG